MYVLPLLPHPSAPPRFVGSSSFCRLFTILLAGLLQAHPVTQRARNEPCLRGILERMLDGPVSPKYP